MPTKAQPTEYRGFEVVSTPSPVVVVKQNGQTEQQAGTAPNLLLTNQGQELLTKSGFISIHDAMQVMID